MRAPKHSQPHDHCSPTQPASTQSWPCGLDLHQMCRRRVRRGALPQVRALDGMPLLHPACAPMRAPRPTVPPRDTNVPARIPLGKKVHHCHARNRIHQPSVNHCRDSVNAVWQLFNAVRPRHAACCLRSVCVCGACPCGSLSRQPKP